MNSRMTETEVARLWDDIPVIDVEMISETLVLGVSYHKGIPTIFCEGELDIYTSPWFHELAERHLTSDQPSLIVDLTKVNFIDAHSWGLLVRILKQVKELGGNVCLVIAEGKNLVRRTFEITKLYEIFHYHPDLATALQYLS